MRPPRWADIKEGDFVHVHDREGHIYLGIVTSVPGPRDESFGVIRGMFFESVTGWSNDFVVESRWVFPALWTMTGLRCLQCFHQQRHRRW